MPPGYREPLAMTNHSDSNAENYVKLSVCIQSKVIIYFVIVVIFVVYCFWHHCTYFQENMNITAK